jgi:hypothetical protein
MCDCCYILKKPSKMEYIFITIITANLIISSFCVTSWYVCEEERGSCFLAIASGYSKEHLLFWGSQSSPSCSENAYVLLTWRLHQMLVEWYSQGKTKHSEQHDRQYTFAYHWWTQNATVRFVCIVELHVTVNSVNILSVISWFWGFFLFFTVCGVGWLTATLRNSCCRSHLQRSIVISRPLKMDQTKNSETWLSPSLSQTVWENPKFKK